MPDQDSCSPHVVLPYGTLPLGLGCSRLGSVNGATPEESSQLLRLALDNGVRFFDTANIYGQGDSEKALGQVLGPHTEAVVCTKAGKYVSWPKRMLLPFKQLLRTTTRRSNHASRTVAAARSQPMPTRWDAPFLTASLEGSLRRLRRERIEVFMLHSPPAEEIRRGEAIGTLQKAQQAGKVAWIGVSVDDVTTAQAALQDQRVQILQLPLHPQSTAYSTVIEQAVRQGVVIVAREILGGAGAIRPAPDIAELVRQRVQETIHTAGVLVPLIGTTNARHLMQAVAAARAATPQP